MQKLGSNILQLTSSKDSELSRLAWRTTNEILGYYSTVTAITNIQRHGPTFAIANKDAECLTVQPGADHWTFEDMVYEHCTQHLDPLLGPGAVANSLIFKNIAFKDVRVIYNGGPLKLDNVYFVNCTFELQPSDKSKVLAETLLASNAITLRLP